ncbi:rab11 family-interacting protein 4B isoform X3 [Culicoides brevitarsis]|uniref:rab11 family-interacting protein 4B isoform X3 n=1 Tax=Culicoides brevitarsis TaxID=469753 RepID=UPI00307C658B
MKNKLLHDTAEPSMPSLTSLDLDYDMWEGQFQITNPSPPFSAGINLETQNNKINSVLHGELRSRLTTAGSRLPISHQILDSEDVFLSLHPSDFESLAIANANAGANSFIVIENGNSGNRSNNIIDEGNRVNNGSSNAFPKREQKMVKGKEFNGNGCAKSNNNNNEIAATELQQRLSEQLEILQRQVTNLADTQNNVDDIKSRTKADYAVLQARYHMLEEQLRDTELRAEERLAEEQKRHRELLNRAERETNLLQENCEIRIRTVEQEKNNVRDELQRLRMQMEKQTLEMQNMEDKLEKTRDNLMNIQQDLVETKASNKRYREEKATTELILKEMETELTLLRQENQERRRSTASNNNNEDIRFEELTRELSELKDQNRQLQEANEELQAMMLTRGVEQGINLLNGTSASLAKELEAMGQQQLQEAYKDKEEENKRLKHYIDTILLNIVENYPQLLEVKSAAP